MPGQTSRIAAALFLLSSSSVAEVPAPVTGARIYTMGEGRDAISAHLPVSGNTVPATSFPCATCHGEDGSGDREGGVEAPALTRARAMSSSGVETWLKRALTRRRRLDGREMAAAMPSYRLSTRDLSALAAFVRQLPYPALPGLTANAVTVSVRATGSGLMARDIAVLEKLVAEQAEMFNKAGGNFGRALNAGVDREDNPSGQASFAQISWRGGSAQAAMLTISVEPHTEGCGALYPSKEEIDQKRQEMELDKLDQSQDLIILPFDIDRQQQRASTVLARGASSSTAASKIVSLIDTFDVVLNSLRESGRRIAPKAMCQMVGDELQARRRATMLRGEALEILSWGL